MGGWGRSNNLLQTHSHMPGGTYVCVRASLASYTCLSKHPRHHMCFGVTMRLEQGLVVLDGPSEAASSHTPQSGDHRAACSRR